MAPQSRDAKTGGGLPKLRILCPETAFFGPKQPQNAIITAKRRETVASLHVQCHFPVTKSPFLPSTPAICPINGPKRAQNGLNVCCLCQIGPKPRTGRIVDYVAQNRILRTPSPPALPPLFVVSNPWNRRMRRLDPCTSAHLVEPEGSPARARWEPTVRPPGSPGRRNHFLPKLFLDHVACSNKCF